jgi:aspartate-semialdehyde dehydrogenase
MSSRFRVGILGATGTVGQRFIQMLERHPQFEVTALAASDRSEGKTYAKACSWRLAGEMPTAVRKLRVEAPRPPLDCDLIFSSLPAEMAQNVEEEFARAGYDAIDNVLPYIQNEEKIERETLKILGRENADEIEPAEFPVSAQCHRVNVSDGHMGAVRVKLARPARLEEVREAFASFTSLRQELRLHTAPERPLIVRDEPDRPQPRLDRGAGGGMSVTVGRIMPDRVLDYRFVALSHNTIRGAAGAAILNAELLIAKGYLELSRPRAA